MTGLTLKSLEGDLGTDPAFLEWLTGRMDAAVIAGAEEVKKAHLSYLVGWASKPSFFFQDIIDIGRLYQARDVNIGGPHAWKWIQINYGADTLKNGPIVGKYMRFPWAGRGASYSPATYTGSPWRKVGTPSVTYKVLDRKIAKRDMIGAVDRNFRNDIFAAMKRGFENG